MHTRHQRAVTEVIGHPPPWHNRLTPLFLRLLLQHKAQAVPSAPKLAQSFRKPKLEDEERLAREREREKAYLAARKKTSTSASFASLYGTKVG